MSPFFNRYFSLPERDALFPLGEWCVPEFRALTDPKEFIMIKHYSIAATFGITAPLSMKVEGFAPVQNVYVPTQKPYVFRKDHLRDVLAFLGAPNGDGLYPVSYTH